MLNDRKYYDDDKVKKKKNLQIELNFYRTRAIGLEGFFIKLGQASF